MAEIAVGNSHLVVWCESAVGLVCSKVGYNIVYLTNIVWSAEQRRGMDIMAELIRIDAMNSSALECNRLWLSAHFRELPLYQTDGDQIH